MLADTSVWIDHFRRRNARLVEQLEAMQVSTHPFVIGELACGNLAHREEVLSALAELPRVPVVPHQEVLAFVDAHNGPHRSQRRRFSATEAPRTVFFIRKACPARAILETCVTFVDLRHGLHICRQRNSSTMNAESIPEYLSPQWFPVGFIVFWLGITGLLAHVGGWARLAEYFRADGATSGERFRFASGALGLRFLPVSYGNCLFVTVAPSGLRLSILFLFRFMTPPLFIPWSVVGSVTSRRFLFLPSVVISLKDQWPRITLRGAAGAAAHSAFLASESPQQS